MTPGLTVTSIGAPARELLADQPPAAVFGHTSSGVFVGTTGREVVYLTAETGRGPLTLNLAARLDGLREQPGEAVAVRADGVWFPRSRVLVNTRTAQVWSPPPCECAPLPPGELNACLAAVAAQVPPPEVTGGELEQALRGGTLEQTAAALTRLLGRGGGLTPAGDDLVLGLLLTFNRWRRLFTADFPLAELNRQMVTEARHRTTDLSASLITCAAQGLASEGLITGLDGVVCGGLPAAACAACFTGWGHSSGAGVFAGVCLALAAMEEI